MKQTLLTLGVITLMGCTPKAVTPEQFTQALNNVAVAVNNLHGRACELEAKQKPAIERAECKPAKAEVKK